jgi:DNA-binding response OmpR family regulator
VTDVLLVTDTEDSVELILPALSLLRDTVRVSSASTRCVGSLTSARLLLVDGRDDLPRVRSFCRLVRSAAANHTVLAVITEGGLAGVSADWLLDDILVTTATPAEVDLRLRLAQALAPSADSPGAAPVIEHGAIRIEPTTRTVTVTGEQINLTYQEFELLAYLAEHAGRVFSRAELLDSLWRRERDVGPRTVDVHVRRIRMALGGDHADQIGTVRRVGYAFVPQAAQLSPTRSLSAHATRRTATPDRQGAGPGSAALRCGVATYS